MSDLRSKRVVVVAHCLLDVNTRLHGIARWHGAHPSVLTDALERGVGLIQLPCPEAGLLGMKRWAAGREQYDTAGFRRWSRRALKPTVDTIQELVRDGVVIERVVGVAGSPSCGALVTSEGFEGGLIDAPASSERVTGSGVFLEVFRAMLSERDIHPEFLDAPEL